MDNLKLCEIHYLQGKHRQYREKVPESLKLQRKRKNKEEEQEQEQETVVGVDNVEETVRVEKEFKMELRKTKKKKVKLAESSESLTDSPSGSVPARKKTLKQCDTQLDLIRMVLEREVEKRKRNNTNKKKNKKKKMKKKVIKEEVELHDFKEGELRRELPNGVMEISPASTPGDYKNVGTHCDVKVGDHKIVAVTPHYFRSKNIDRVALGKLQVVPYGPSLKKGNIKRKCHSCQRSDSLNLVQCSSCHKEFFCFDCIRDRFVILTFIYCVFVTM